METTIKTEAPKRYQEFDGLRGWLSLWVTLAHILCWCGFGSLYREGAIAKLWSEFTSATIAVEVFIILSGFAIFTLIHREPCSYRRYMTGRFFRIYPVYALCLGLSIALVPLTHGMLLRLPWHDDFYITRMLEISDQQSLNLPAHIGWHVALLHGAASKALLGFSATTLLKPAWTISLEWQFYLIAPLLAMLLRNSWGIAIVALVALLGRFTDPLWGNPDNAFLPIWLPFFMVGIGCYYLANFMAKREELRQRYGGVLVAAFMGCAVFLADNKMTLVIWTLAFTASLGSWESFFPSLGQVLRWVLNNRFAQWLGGMSYPLYLVHWPLIILFLNLLHALRPEADHKETLALMLGLGLPVILLITWVLHRVIEKPFMRLGRRLSKRPIIHA